MDLSKYWVYENGYLRGPFEVKDLTQRAGFSVTMMICQDGDHVWRPIHAIPEIAPALSDLAHAEILASGDYIAETPAPLKEFSVIESDSKEADPQQK